MAPALDLSLADLVPGGAVNVRPDEDASDLVPSIRAHGLLQPLIGRMRRDGKIEIIEGNRRLRALRQIQEEDDRDVTAQVMLREDLAGDADAYEVSLAANIMRRALHPVAEFEAFASLVEQGRTPEAVAEHFGITARQVEQRLALGRLHPDVRAAWREGRISGEAARAFTLADPTAQAAYLAKAMYPHELQPGNVRRAFTRETIDGSNGVALFVGEAAYEAAGGKLLHDLFSIHPLFCDGDLLNGLGREKLKDTATLIAAEEGWAEGLIDEEASDSHRWQRLIKPALPDEAKPARQVEIESLLSEIDDKLAALQAEAEELDADDASSEARLEEIDRSEADLQRRAQALEAELERFDVERAAWLTLPAETRAKAVILCRIGREGGIDITRGLLKDKVARAESAPRTALSTPAPKAEAGEPDEAAAPERFSAALLNDLALTATRAAAHTLADNPQIALAAFVAAHATYGAPVRIAVNGKGEGPALPWSEKSYSSKLGFADIFKLAQALDSAHLLSLVARIIAQSLDFTASAIMNHNMDSLTPDAAQALRLALPHDAHRAALVQAFDAEAFFKTAPKPQAMRAIAECGDEPAKHAKLKKGELAAVAARHARERGWLPGHLRGAIFDAVLPPAEPEPDAPDAVETESAPGDERSAAEAARDIWNEEDGEEAEPEQAEAEDWWEKLTMPALRAELKARGVKAPFNANREALVDLARGASQAEAA